MGLITAHLLYAPTLLLLSSLVIVASATGYGHVLKPNIKNPKPQLYPHPQPQPKFEHIGVEGRVLCRQGPRVALLKGGVTRMTCLAQDENGYETAPFSKLNPPSDSNGYFFGTLCRSEVGEKVKLKECKVFLESSPLETCDVPTDENGGISGAPLTNSHHRLFNGNNMKLYSLQPFSFTCHHQEPKSTVPNGY